MFDGVPSAKWIARLVAAAMLALLLAAGVHLRADAGHGLHGLAPARSPNSADDTGAVLRGCCATWRKSLDGRWIGGNCRQPVYEGSRHFLCIAEREHARCRASVEGLYLGCVPTRPRIGSGRPPSGGWVRVDKSDVHWFKGE